MSNPPLDRRRFIQTGIGGAAAAAVGLPASASMFGRRVRDLGGLDTVKVGLIGCGGRGTGAAFQAMNADPHTILWSMGDLFQDRISSSAKNLGNAMGDQSDAKFKVDSSRQFTGWDAYKRVIESDIDVVILTTPPHFRPRQIELAVEAGKHVFLEKPMAVDPVGARRVMAAAEKAKEKGLAVVAGFCWRYHDAMQAAFGELANGRIGEVNSVHTTYHAGTLSPRPRQPEWTEMEFQLRNWWHFCWISGDHIAEQACHSIDRLAWAMGDRTPVRATCLGGRQARSGETSGNVYDHFSVIYEYDDGKRCHHTCRQIDGTPGDNSDYVYGTEGSAYINGWTAPYGTFKNLAGEVVWEYDGHVGDMYQNEHDALFKSIRDGDPINDGEWMCRSTMMSIMGRMAAYTGQTVTWDHMMNSELDLTPASYEFGPIGMRPIPVPGKTELI